MESILTSIKKLLGPNESNESFDMDIIMHINSVFSILTQLGVGPSSGFSIQDKDNTWAEFLGSGLTLEFVKSFVYLKVRLLFDPPQSSAVIESINRQLSELEWRIAEQVDDARILDEQEEIQNGE